MSSPRQRRALLVGSAVLVAVGAVAAVVLAARDPAPAAEDAPPESRLIVVLPAARARAMLSSLTVDDLEAIQRELPVVRRAAPVLNLRAQVLAEEANWFTWVVGSSPDYFPIRRWRAARGRILGDGDANARVVVLGETVAKQLFGAGADPVGRSVRIQKQAFEVVGVLERKGETPFQQDQDDIAVVPVAVFRARLQPGLSGRLGGSIFVEAFSAEESVRTEESIRQLLRVRHRLAPGAEADFSIRNVGAAMRELQRMKKEKASAP